MRDKSVWFDARLPENTRQILLRTPAGNKAQIYQVSVSQLSQYLIVRFVRIERPKKVDDGQRNPIRWSFIRRMRQRRDRILPVRRLYEPVVRSPLI